MLALPMGYDVCEDEYAKMGAAEACRYEELAPPAVQGLVYEVDDSSRDDDRDALNSALRLVVVPSGLLIC